MRRLLTALTVALMALSLSACYPETKHPLSSPEGSLVDQKLIGLWYGGAEDDADDHAYYAFLNVGGNDIDVLGFHFSEGDDEWIRLRLHTTTINENAYLSFTFADESESEDEVGEEEGAEGSQDDEETELRYIICRYIFPAEDQLKIYSVNEESLKQTLQTMASSEAELASWIDEVGLITAPTSVLRRAVEQSDPANMFDDLVGVYERVG